jgi:hypothetical protein
MFCHETKALKETLNALVLKVSTMSDLKGPLKHQEEAVIHFIHVQEGPNPTLFGPLMNKTLLTFSVLTCERDSRIFSFLNEYPSSL